MLILFILFFKIKKKQYKIKIEPINTCKPWKPVVIKNLAPKEFSLTEKLLFLYSKNWINVKKIPKNKVKKKKFFLFLFINKRWCAQVIVKPLVKRIQVFKNGIWKGSIEIKKNGGQTDPILSLGTKLLWKKAQNQPKKNITSLKIKRIIPIFKLVLISKEWTPIILS